MMMGAESRINPGLLACRAAVHRRMRRLGLKDHTAIVRSIDLLIRQDLGPQHGRKHGVFGNIAPYSYSYEYEYRYEYSYLPSVHELRDPPRFCKPYVNPSSHHVPHELQYTYAIVRYGVATAAMRRRTIYDEQLCRPPQRSLQLSS